jgi:hypothetical protein
MGWAASAFTPIAQFGWGAVVLAGVGAACVMMFAASAVLAAWRYFNPLLSNAGTASAFDSEQDLLGARSERLMQLIASHEISLTEINTTMINLTKDTESRISALELKLTAVDQGITEQISLAADAIRKESNQLTERVLALKTIYEMRTVMRDLERLLVLLERPLKSLPEQRDWTGWQARFQKFTRAMNLFSRLAGTYFPREAQNLTQIDPGIYRIDDGDFAMTNFPDLQTAHDFKTFRQLSNSYEGFGRDLFERIEVMG